MDKIEQWHLLVTVILATMPDVRLKGVDNGYSEQRCHDTKVAVLGHPVFLEREIVLTVLV